MWPIKRKVQMKEVKTFEELRENGIDIIFTNKGKI